MTTIDMTHVTTHEPIPTEIAMDGETFETFVERERERLNGRLEEIANQERALLEEREGIERELAGISAYVAAKEGRLDMTAAKPTRARRASTGSRGPRGQRRTQVLEAIQGHEEGLTRGDIIEILGEKGNKSGEQSISNALSALKKADQIDARDGRYFAS